jgi:hypothetical protein
LHCWLLRYAPDGPHQTSVPFTDGSSLKVGDYRCRNSLKRLGSYG